MSWFSKFSIALFLALIARSLLRIAKADKGTKTTTRECLLITIFCIHIAVILYLGFG